MKRIGWPALLAALLLTPALAGASVWQGATEAADTVDVKAAAEGILEQVPLRVGEMAEAGTVAAVTRTERVFAPIDGRVNGIKVLEGEKCGDTVLTIEPLSPYTVYCTVESAWRTHENALLHPGQRVWIRCDTDGSHRAVGRVTLVSGGEYVLEVLGGDLFVGEAVIVFREGSFDEKDRLGKGTAVSSEAVNCTGEGYLLKLAVSEGEEGERGELLFETASALQTETLCPASGWVTAVSVSEGSSVKETSTVATLATRVQLRVEAEMADAAGLREGAELRYTRADDPHTLRPCRVTRVYLITRDEKNAVTSAQTEQRKIAAVLEPLDEPLLPIGLTVSVTDETTAQ